MSELELAFLPAPAFALDGGAMFGIVPRAMWAQQTPPDTLNRIPMTTRCVLVSCGNRHSVIDPGMGRVWDETAIERYGIVQPSISLDSALSEKGLNRTDITDVFLTHLHFDHLGGCFEQEASGALSLCFPKARHHVQAAQWDWANKPSAKDRGSYFPEWLDALADSGKLELHAGSFDLLPGFHAFPVDGHTPAQQLCRLETADGAWVYGGDLFPLAAHLRMAWVMAYDIEPLKTLEAKQRVLREYLSDDAHLIFGHDVAIAAARLDCSGKHPVPIDLIKSEQAR